MILLDTHTLVWLASDTGKLSLAAQNAILAHPVSLHFSIVSAWEISLLVKRGRLILPFPPEEYLTRAIAHHRLIELPLTRRVAQASVSLPDIHNDPFDRILIAECHERSLSLISRDAIIPGYPGVRVIWG
ncbi:MAG: type II toxin-antitoxin system VapC family toxin [bacterium]|jgi:PIN domain nuclease of toxin-antitoxin system